MSKRDTDESESEGTSTISSQKSFGIINAVEVISICTFVTGGAFLVAGWLVGQLGSEPPTDNIQLALWGTGVAVAGIGGFTRWLLSRYG